MTRASVLYSKDKMADDRSFIPRRPPEKLPRAGQIPDAIVTQPARPLSNDLLSPRQLSEPTVSPPDHRLPQLSERGAPRIIAGIIWMAVVLAGLAIASWWLRR